jgi:hypothetical protein
MFKPIGGFSGYGNGADCDHIESGTGIGYGYLDGYGIAIVYGYLDGYCNGYCNGNGNGYNYGYSDVDMYNYGKTYLKDYGFIDGNGNGDGHATVKTLYALNNSLRKNT